jgi:hypothetical protein
VGKSSFGPVALAGTRGGNNTTYNRQYAGRTCARAPRPSPSTPSPSPTIITPRPRPTATACHGHGRKPQEAASRKPRPPLRAADYGLRTSYFLSSGLT